MKKYLFTALFIFTVVLSGCEKDADVNVPKVDPKLVVQSYISPQDTLLIAFVSKTTPVFGKKYFDTNGNFTDQVRNAVVTLSNGNRSIKLEYDEYNISSGYQQTGFAYLADAKLFPIVAGETYTLKVSTPDGLQAESTCTVPQNVPTIHDLNLNYAVRNDRFNQDYKYYEYSFSFAIRDIPNIANYYRVAGEIYTLRFNEYDEEFYEDVTPIHFYEDGIINYQPKDGIDIIAKGQMSFYNSSEEVLPKPFTVRIHVLNVDQHYYKYHQTSRASNMDNPFQEPVIIYSNINGGLGVFSAFNRTYVDFIIE